MQKEKTLKKSKKKNDDPVEERVKKTATRKTKQRHKNKKWATF